MIGGKIHEISSYEHRAGGHKIYKIRLIYTHCEHCGSSIPQGSSHGKT